MRFTIKLTQNATNQHHASIKFNHKTTKGQ